MVKPESHSIEKKRRALVLIPGAVNYFYNLCGRRLAETLRELDFEVDLGLLAQLPQHDYDWCVLSNITEVVYGFGNEYGALDQLLALKKRCRVMTSTSIDSVATPWYGKIRELCGQIDIQTILDFSLHDQRELLPAEAWSTYHYLPAGLTTSEWHSLQETRHLDHARTIPWAFVGHYTPDRAALVDFLVRKVDPRGFVYIPRVAVYKEKDSPHLNQQQFDAVLRRTAYQIWSSHHSAFYMESERFRMSLLAGGVPIKVLVHAHHQERPAPFSYLMMREEELAERLSDFDFVEVRRLFQEDFQRIPSLKQGLTEFLVSHSVIDSREVKAPGNERNRFARAA